MSSDKTPVCVSAVTWTLVLLLAAAALVLGPLYLIEEVRATTAPPSTSFRTAPSTLRQDSTQTSPRTGGYEFDFLAVSFGWSREILAALHVLFLAAIVMLAAHPTPRRLAARMTGVSAMLGIWEIALSVGAIFLAEKARFAPPNMTVAALGALLLLGGIGLNLDAILQKLTSPKTPVVLIFTIATLVAAAAFALIGFLNVRHYERVDYTRAGRYSLPPATADLLTRLDKTIKITTLFVVRDLADDTLKREATDLLDEYARTSGRIELNHIDLRRDVKATKELVRRAAEKDVKIEENSVIIECPATSRLMKVAAHEMLRTIQPELTADEIRRAAKGEKLEQKQPEFRFLGPSILHQALSIVTAAKPVTLYFVVGHGEKPNAIGPPVPGLTPEIREQLVKVFSTEFLERGLRRLYYRIKTLELDASEDQKQEIPDDCDVLVISGPWCAHIAQFWEMGGMKKFSKEAADSVRKYLERGGRAFVMLDPMGPRYARMIAPLLALLKDYGVEAAVNDIVVDERLVPQIGTFGRLTLQPEPSALFMANLAKDYQTGEAAPGIRPTDLHPCISALGELPIAVVECAELRTQRKPGLRHTALLTTTDKAWLQPRPEPGQPFHEGDRDNKRRRTVALAVENDKTRQPALVVLGGSNMFVQPMINFNNVADNHEFAEKVIAWLAGSTEQLAVKQRPTEIAYGEATASTVRTIRFISVLVIPSIFILAGAVIWLGRRK